LRILVVDDHDFLREGLVSVLRRHEDMDVVAQAGSAAEALIAFRRDKPDVAIVDLRLPDKPGSEVIKELHADYPEARFVVLTTYDTPEDAYRAFLAGASAYVLKATPAARLVEVIRRVAAGERLIPEPVRQMLAHDRLRVELSAREREVLALLAEGHSNREIGASLGISAETVKSHLERMRDKLDAPDRAALLAKAIKLGLIDL
jgi:DNA-binding NarL/FixJ family response regulator